MIPSGKLHRPRPIIALTLGDVAGIGPEIVARACMDARVNSWCCPVVVGHPEVLRRALVLIGSTESVLEVSGPKEICDSAGIKCWNPAGDDARDVPRGALDARAGRAAHDYLVAAARAALDGSIDAITTAPLNKAALHLAGIDAPGHTEILAATCGVEQYAMMLYLPPGDAARGPHGLGVAHVTLHTSIRSVPELLSTKAIRGKIELVDAFLRDLGCQRPRVGVCALNPHAGEQGLFGDEEQRIIAPAVEAARAAGFDASGPIPADALLRRALSGEFDGVVAMYHDQGHIALKLIGFDRAVNVTLGLPIVRTSPSHGTAFDIAWTGRANAEGMIGAIRVAALLSAKRNAKAAPTGAIQ